MTETPRTAEQVAADAMMAELRKWPREDRPPWSGAVGYMGPTVLEIATIGLNAARAAGLLADPEAETEWYFQWLPRDQNPPIKCLDEHDARDRVTRTRYDAVVLRRTIGPLQEVPTDEH